jgi:hypothetical protein
MAHKFIHPFAVNGELHTTNADGAVKPTKVNPQSTPEPPLLENPKLVNAILYILKSYNNINVSSYPFNRNTI